MFTITFYKYVLEIHRDELLTAHHLYYTELYDFTKQATTIKEAFDLWDLYAEFRFGFAEIRDNVIDKPIQKTNHDEFLKFYKQLGIKELIRE